MATSGFLSKCLSQQWYERVGSMWFSINLNTIWFYVTIDDGNDSLCNFGRSKQWVNAIEDSYDSFWMWM